jgi:hypothetical protein
LYLSDVRSERQSIFDFCVKTLISFFQVRQSLFK